MQSGTRIENVEVSAYKIPTDLPESDGTFAWNDTTLVLVEATAGNKRGLGYSYADVSTAELIRSSLVRVIVGREAMEIEGSWSAMVQAVRNLGLPGICAMAISAVDNALWDLKARLLGLPLVSLLGAARESLPIYGSGGFTSYSVEKLQEQLRGWVEQGIAMVKMKIGREPAADIKRVEAARQAIGNDAQLFVDANGAYPRKEALAFAQAFRDFNVTWFEEPVVSDDLEGLRLLRDRSPAGMDISAGEYGYELSYFRRMLEVGAVDVLQADATRCCGITGFMKVGALCEAFHIPLSSHCAPALHAHPGCALRPMRHAEYFHDHARIERMLFEGVLPVTNGRLEPDLSQPGIGLQLKRADAAKYLIGQTCL